MSELTLTPEQIEQWREQLHGVIGSCAQEYNVTEADEQKTQQEYAALDALCDMTLRSLRQPEREGWQPIATAPKDGTCILVSNEYGSWIAKYVPEYQSGYRPAVPWMSMMLNHDHMRWGVRALVPTNWQPLPALQSEEK